MCFYVLCRGGTLWHWQVYWELFRLRTEIASLGGGGERATREVYLAAEKLALKVIKSKQPRNRKRKDPNDPKNVNAEPGKKKRKKVPVAVDADGMPLPQRPPPAKGDVLQAAMVEEAADGGIEWVSGKVTSVNVSKRSFTMSVTADSETWSEKYKLKEEGEEWRWPLAEASTLLPSSTGLTKHGEDGISLADVDTANSNTGAAEASTPLHSPNGLATSNGDSISKAVQPAENNPSAAASRAAGAADSTHKQELKIGAIVECACDAEDGFGTIEWHPGSGAINSLRSFLLRMCTHSASDNS